ncbi:hypothetical protein [Bacillus sp. V2I10]|uniref:hypothetical protein n=1 Tax=Bacillus sp. V2I10 TaxID=3042276 RepID=UPI002789D549|nr:hypothetical protein [Bacillus sp. V2I10]MDQ0859580.1 Na+-transporting methylmalonyl-CoA/oxaloacetate decarboxylase gamma subunit [Bacillus sp. V2I10]
MEVHKIISTLKIGVGLMGLEVGVGPIMLFILILIGVVIFIINFVKRTRNKKKNKEIDPNEIVVKNQDEL